MVAALLAGLDRRDDEVSANAVGYVGLLAVDYPAAVDALRAGPQRGDIRAGARLGDAERTDELAADRRSQVALLLLLGAELPDRRRRDVDARREKDLGVDSGSARSQSCRQRLAAAGR